MDKGQIVGAIFIDFQKAFDTVSHEILSLKLNAVGISGPLHQWLMNYLLDTVEPRFNEVAGDRPNLFVKSRVRYIENLDITNLRGNDQNVRYIEVIVND